MSPNKHENFWTKSTTSIKKIYGLILNYAKIFKDKLMGNFARNLKICILQ